MSTTTRDWFARSALSLFAIAGVIGLSEPAVAEGAKPSRAVASVSQFARGLQYPRGLKFGPDGHLYVAEAGEGPTSAANPPPCDAKAGPVVYPYTSSATGGRISRIDFKGRRTTVTDSFPRAVNALGDALGVADVTFVDGKLYALVASGGCSHGVGSIPSGVARVHADGSWQMIADLSAYQRANRVATPEPADFEPDGTWYSMIAVHDDLYAVEPNHGELVKITTKGQVSRVVDVSASQGHVVPTAVAHRHGAFFVGNLGEFDPSVVNQQDVFRVTPGAPLAIFASGLSKVLGVAFDSRGRLYVLEMTVGQQFPAPGLGRIVRVTRHGSVKVVATGLSLPTAMTFGPDDDIYVSNWGFGPPGMGEILRIELPDDDDD